MYSNLSGSFTLCFSLYMGLEKLNWTKLIGILVSFSGVVMIGLDDKDDEGRKSFYGDIIALISAGLYGLYTTVLRSKSPDDDDFPMQLVLGYVGLINGIILCPVVIILERSFCFCC